MTRSARIRRILAEAPATSRKIARELNIPTRKATAAIQVLNRQGHIRYADEMGVTEDRWLYLYTLTKRGRDVALRDREREREDVQLDARTAGASS